MNLMMVLVTVSVGIIGIKAERLFDVTVKTWMRDFTYIDDIVEGVLRVMQGVPQKATGEDGLPVPPYAIYNIGGGQCVRR